MFLFCKPRVCGEKFNDPPVLEPELGSPPHMRGKASAEPGLAGKVGITPAYAGKSGEVVLTVPVHWDHPRVCGEKCKPCKIPNPTPGSPPRMRGKAIAFPGSLLPSGITPAYAGKRSSCRIRTRPEWDHPRICGEKSNSVICVLPFWDHPRICGEKLNHDRVPGVGKGSPPHMRGKETKDRLQLGAGRITPAYAGKSHPVAKRGQGR